MRFPTSRLRALAAIFVIVFMTGGGVRSAGAQNATVPVALELYPTLSCIGARLVYAGDADSDAVTHLEWRVAGSGIWKRGMDLTRISGSRWAGSVLWLQPLTPCEVRAVVEDPDGGGALAGIATTRREPITTPPTRTWWVATTGSDANAGGAATPLATIQAAVDRAGAGEEVRVRAGIYRQTVRATTPGTALAPIRLVADAPGVVLDGSDPAYLQRTDWVAEGGGIYSAPFTGVTRLVCVDSLARLYRQDNLAGLQGNFNGMAEAWTIAGGRLYVKLAGGSSPVGHLMHVARYDVGIRIDAPHWRVAGFEVRYFGTLTVPWPEGPASSGILVRGADDCHVTGNHVHTIGGKGIYLTLDADDNLIENNLCRDPRIGIWPRGVSKSHEEEIQGISMRGNRGNVIRNNTCTGTFDGIDATGDTLLENRGADTDIHDNLVSVIPDDGIEPEGMHAINVRVWKNRITGAFNGMSISPNWTGPTYVLFNTIENYTRGGFKFSLGSTARTWIEHNTVTSSVAGTDALHPTGPYSNMRFRNNILTGNGTYPVGDDPGESQTGNDFDGDLLYSINTSKLFYWKGVSYATLALLRAATGFEVHGLAGNPLFANAAAGNYALLAGSPARDAALRRYGVNDAFAGAAPDIGAWESGVTLDTPLPPARVPAALGPCSPNPFRAATRLTLTLDITRAARLDVLDVAGRRVRRLGHGVFEAGRHPIEWDGRDDAGRPAPAGLYFVRLEGPGAALARPVILAR